MRKRIFTYIVAVALCSLLLTGCEEMLTPEELINDPSTTKGMEEINKIIKDYLPKGAEITMPIRLNGTGAINFQDMDGCGVDEVVVLFKKPMPEAELGVLILKKDVAWIPWKYIDLLEYIGKDGSPAYDIHTVEFKDLTGDKNPELIVGCFFKEDESKKVLIFTCKDGEMVEMDSMFYDDISLIDFNRDNSFDIFVLNKDEKKKSSASFFVCNELKISKVDQIVFKESVENFKILKFGLASADQPAVFIQKNVEDSINYLQIITLKDNKLTSIYNNVQNYTADLEDINGDGIIEIKKLESLKVKDPLAPHFIPQITTWNVLDDLETLKIVRREFYNAQYDYTVEIPLEWGTNFTIISKNGINANYINFVNVVENFIITDSFFSIAVVDSVELASDAFQDQLKDKKYVVLQTDVHYSYIAIAGDNKLMEDESLELAVKIFKKMD